MCSPRALKATRRIPWSTCARGAAGPTEHPQSRFPPCCKHSLLAFVFPCCDPKNFRLSLFYCTGLLSTFPFHASSPFSTPQTVEMQAAKETHHDAVTGDQEHPAAGVFPLQAPQAVHRCSSPWGPAGRHWRRTAWKAVCEKPRCSESLPLLPGSARELNRAPRPIAILQTTKAGHTHSAGKGTRKRKQRRDSRVGDKREEV